MNIETQGRFLKKSVYKRRTMLRNKHSKTRYQNKQLQGYIFRNKQVTKDRLKVYGTQSVICVG